MTPYGLLLELAAGALIATLFNRYCVYQPDVAAAAAWRLFWRATRVTAPLCALGIALSLAAPAAGPLLTVGLGIDIIAGLAGLLVMGAASIRALRHGVHRWPTRREGGYR